MYGSLAMGGRGARTVATTSHVADFRLLNAALTSRIALEQARRSLADAVATGAQTREAQQHFFASIGHELRTPLTAIVGYTEMLVDEAAQHEADPFAEAVGRDGGGHPARLRAADGRRRGPAQRRAARWAPRRVARTWTWLPRSRTSCTGTAPPRAPSDVDLDLLRHAGPDRVGARRGIPAGALQPDRQRRRAQPGRFRRGLHPVPARGVGRAPAPRHRPGHGRGPARPSSSAHVFDPSSATPDRASRGPGSACPCPGRSRSATAGPWTRSPPPDAAPPSGSSCRSTRATSPPDRRGRTGTAARRTVSDRFRGATGPHVAFLALGQVAQLVRATD